MVLPSHNDDVYFDTTSYTELGFEHNFKQMTSVETLKDCLSKGRFLIHFDGLDGMRLFWFRNKSHMRRWERGTMTCCSLYLELREYE